MPSLSCNVKECSHNSNCLCALDSVSVSGGGSKENTCCSSFSTSSSASNCCKDASPETKVDCKANDCKHNEDCECHASSIDVCNCGSGCTCHDTECASFSEK